MSALPQLPRSSIISRIPHLHPRAVYRARALAVVLAVAGLLLPAASAGHAAGVPFTNVVVSHDTYVAHSEPALAENPANPNNLVAGSKFFTNLQKYAFKIGTYSSEDGGRTWQDNGVLPGFQGYSSTSDISFAFSPNGSLVYAAVLACSTGICLNNLTKSGIFVSRSRDGGKTWSKPITVFLDTSGQFFSDKPWIAVDQTHGPHRGEVYVGWNLDGGADKDNEARVRGAAQQIAEPVPGLVMAHSTDYGKSWSDPVEVAPFGVYYSALGVQPAVGPDGTLYAAYMSFTDSVTTGKETTSLDVSVSTDGGVTFSHHVAVPHVTELPNHLPNGTFRNLSLPSFAVSPVDGSLVLVWADERNGDADVLVTRSRDRAHTWSTAVRVNHDALHNGKDQFQPALAVAPDGVFTCSWFDRRRDPQNRRIDVYIAQSTDDGVHFGKNLRVTTSSWDPSIGAPWSDAKPNNTFIGDYQALAVDNNAVHPLWNDTQNGSSQQIRTAVLAESVFARH